jgi:putative Holliday junction resolvase
MALAAIDFGFKRLGVAISDAAGIGAYPLFTIARTSFAADLKSLHDALSAREITKLIIGLPLNLDGTEGALARAARGFAERVKRELKLETAMFDERLTSFEARERIKAAKPSRSGRNRPIDAHAAAVILESYMASAGRGDEQPE